MRYVGPLPFAEETLGDLWDASPETHRAVEAAVAEARARWEDEGEEALEKAQEQVSFASSLLDDLDTALQSATRLRDFRKTFSLLVRGSSFEGA